MVVKSIIKKKTVLAIFICAIGLLLPMAVRAATPAYEQVESIKLDKSVKLGSGGLAMGGDGSLYVLDSYKSQILKFDRNGNVAGSIFFPKVSAMAAASNGTLYVGSYMDYAVAIVKKGTIVGYLGSGPNEFKSIRDIAVDPSSGRVFVVDNVGNAVRIYDASGKYFGAIDLINLPVSIDITDTAIYIIDSPLVKEGKFTTTGSRISIFDKDFSLTGTIDEPAGQQLMYRPTDIAVGNGIIYVSDAALRSVLAFDMVGNFLGEIKGAGGGIDTAVSLALASDGMLYVSSSETYSICKFLTTVTPGGTGY